MVAIERQRWITQDLKALGALLDGKQESIRLLKQSGEGVDAHVFLFETRLPLIIGVGVEGQNKYRIPFHIKVTLPRGYPRTASPMFRIRPIPYHPLVDRPSFFRSFFTDWATWTGRFPNGLALSEQLELLIRCLVLIPEALAQVSPKSKSADVQGWYQSVVKRGSYPLGAERFRQSSSGSGKTFAMETEVVAGGSVGSAANVIVRKRFDIEKITPAYRPEKGSVPRLTGVTPSNASKASGSYQLIITKRAARDILDHVHWGEEPREPLHEQGGILLGYAIEDIRAGVICGVVKRAVPGEPSRASSVYLELNHDAWWRMYAIVDDLSKANSQRGLHIVGWYHTHPGSLGVFMSGTDLNTQRTVFRADWQFAVVMNPQRCIWRAYHGPHAEECLGFLEG